MHTVFVMAGGFALLFLCLLGRNIVGGRRRALLVFLPVWLLAALVNLWVGVTHAGYTVKEEVPIFLLIFTVPAVTSLLLLWRWKSPLDFDRHE